VGSLVVLRVEPEDEDRREGEGEEEEEEEEEEGEESGGAETRTVSALICSLLAAKELGN
jgi:hypothetical protein